MKLICIDDVVDIIGFGDGVKELTWGKEYEIVNFYDIKGDGREYISVINDKGKRNDYYCTRKGGRRRPREDLTEVKGGVKD